MKYIVLNNNNIINYLGLDIVDKIINLNNLNYKNNEITFKTNDQIKKTLRKPIKKKIEKRKTLANQNIHQSYSETSEEKEGKIGFFSFLLVTIISLVSLVILLDTFKFYLSGIIPNIDFYLYSLYDTLKDIFLFFTDLLK